MGSAEDVIRRLFDRFTQRDAAGVVALFADDGVFQDPHYPPPVGPVMQGHAAIQAGMEWAFGMLEWSRFEPMAAFADPSEPSRGAFEVATTHKLFNGPELPVSQVFLVELDGDGLIRRTQSYVPYPPPAPPTGG
jgi:ketosteroid isomerase-like protein